MDREAWRAVVREVAKSRTRLSNWTELNTFLFIFPFLPSIESCPSILFLPFLFNISWDSAASLVAQMVKNLTCNVGDPGSLPESGKIPWRREWLSTPVFLPGNPIDRGTWKATVHGVAKSRTLLKRLNTHIHTYPGILFFSKIILCFNMLMEKAMAPHSSSLAWKIPWMEEPGRLQSMGSLGVRHYWATSLHFPLSCTGEGNGNPLQCSCLENPRDGEPGGLPFMGSHRVGHNWSDLA